MYKRQVPYVVVVVAQTDRIGIADFMVATHKESRYAIATDVYKRQTIGCTYGGPTEFKYRGAIIHEKTPIIWYDDYCKDIFAEDPGL